MYQKVDFLKRKIQAVLLIGVMLSTASLGDCFAEAIDESSIPNIMIVVLGGVRDSESIADRTHQYMPYFWKELRPRGTLYTNVNVESLSVHQPADFAVLTGQKNTYYSYDNAKRCAPNILQYVRQKYGWPASKFWVVGFWDIFDGQCAARGLEEETFPSFLTTGMEMSNELKTILSVQEEVFVSAARSTESVRRSRCLWDSLGAVHYQLVRKLSGVHKPKMVFYIMNEVEAAHFGSYGRYVLGLKKSDERIYELWQMIQKDSFYAGNTYLFILPDHGRDAQYMRHETSGLLSHSWMYVFGPDIRKNAVIDRKILQQDIFPTVARIMNTPVPVTEGRILEDCFSGGDISPSISVSPR